MTAVRTLPRSVAIRSAIDAALEMLAAELDDAARLRSLRVDVRFKPDGEIREVAVHREDIFAPR